MLTKDTTILISAAEDMAEVDQVLVLHPQQRRPPPSSNLRLRLMFLVGVASLALICIVFISQQLIVRHMRQQQPAHLVLEVNLPQEDQPFQDQMRQQFSQDFIKQFNTQDLSETEIVQLDDDSPTSLDIDLADLPGARLSSELSSLEGTRNGLDLLASQVSDDQSEDVIREMMNLVK